MKLPLLKLPMLKLPAMKLSAILERLGAVALLVVSVLLLTSALKLHGANMGGASATAYCPDPTTQNLAQIGSAVEQYIQDSDEMLPVVHTQADFQTALLPYTHNSAVFISPETGQPFVFNLGLSGLSDTQISDPDTTEVAREDPAPANQPAAVLFFDGYVERGGVEVGDPGQIVVSRAKALAIGVIEYTQDYDETYPPMQTQAQFQAAVQPYVGVTRDFFTPSGAAFVPNPNLSGQSAASVSSPSTTMLFSEPPPYTGGLDTVAYADGHVTRGGIEPSPLMSGGGAVSRAKQLGLAVIEYTQDYDETFPPMQTQQAFQTAVQPYARYVSDFSTPTGSLFIPNPSLSGISLSSVQFPLSDTVLFQDAPPYADGYPTTCYADGHVVHQQPFVPVTIVTTPNLLWDNVSGQIAVWTLGSGGGFTQNDHGPFPGWTAQALASGPDQIPRLLWTNTSGEISTWAVSAGGGYTHNEYGPYPGWTASGLAVGPDDAPHLLWTNTNGELSLWTIAPDGTFTFQNYGPYPQWTAQTLSVDANNHVHVLWTRTDGTVSLWDVDASGIPAFQNFGPYPGWTALALASGPDGYSHILWNHAADGQLSLWETGIDGTFGHQEYGPYPGWAASSLTVGADNQVHVLWSDTHGMASLWTLDCLGSFTFADYGPYPGWSTQSFSAGR